jgi:DNA-binding MarR family transcriptional regulator/GNAT superfamily N-acetyltransferase
MPDSMDFIEDLGYLAVASRMKRLTDRFLRGGIEAYKSLLIDFEPRLFTIFYLIFTRDTPLSISDISHSLKITHPAVIQTTQVLIKKGLIQSFPDTQDRRVRRVAITEKGKELANFLIPVWNDFETATIELFEKAGIDMLEIIQRIEHHLDEEDIGSRIITRIKQRQYNAISVSDDLARYKKFFQDLNYEWLEKYFKVEEWDKKLLENPEKEIIRRGGIVLFALLDDEVVGTTAVLKRDDRTFEIAKMAVTEDAQGKQVGRRLTKEAIDWATGKGAKVLVLKTDNRLRPAVNLYRSFGFKVSRKGQSEDEIYERERFGIKMTLEL